LQDFGGSVVVGDGGPEDHPAAGGLLLGAAARLVRKAVLNVHVALLQDAHTVATATQTRITQAQTRPPPLKVGGGVGDTHVISSLDGSKSTSMTTVPSTFFSTHGVEFLPLTRHAW